MRSVSVKFAAAMGLVLAGLAFTGTSAFAHHSGAMFDDKRKVELVGTIKLFEWTNPHSRVWIYANKITDITDPKKKVVRNAPAPELWTIEGGSPGNLTRGGWTKRTLNPGDKATVIVKPLRSGSHGGLGAAYTEINGKPFEKPRASGKESEANLQ